MVSARSVGSMTLGIARGEQPPAVERSCHEGLDFGREHWWARFGVLAGPLWLRGHGRGAGAGAAQLAITNKARVEAQTAAATGDAAAAEALAELELQDFGDVVNSLPLKQY